LVANQGGDANVIDAIDADSAMLWLQITKVNQIEKIPGEQKQE